MAANLELLIKAKDEASATLKNIDKSAGGLGKTMGTALKVGAIAGAAGIGIAVFAGIKFIKAAADEEVGVKRLATALEAAGGSWTKQSKAIEETIRQREKLAFADDELRDSLSVLLSQTGNLDDALRRQTVAMDFARGANIDLNTASKLLGKVTDENVNVLKRYGINVKEGADATDVLAEVQRRFSGQSEAFADTAVGKWQRFNNTLGNIKETIGAALLPVMLALTDVLQSMADNALPKVEALTQKLSELVAPVITDGVTILKEKFGDFVGVLETVKESSTFKAFLDGINEGLINVKGAATDAKDTIITAFGEIEKLMGTIPGLSKLPQIGAEAKPDTGAAKTAGKALTEAVAGVLALSVGLTLLDRSINIVGNSMGAFAAVITTGMAIFLAPNPFLLFLAGLALLIGGLAALEIKTGFLSKEVLPILKDISQWVNTHVVPAFQQFARTEALPWLKNVATTLKTDFIPAIEHVADVFKRDWLPAIQGAAIAIGQFLYPALDTLHDLWVGAIVPTLTGAVIPALEWLGKAVADVVKWFSEHKTATEILVGALTGLAVGLVLLLNPWLLVVGAIVLVLAKWDEISGFFIGLGKLVGETVTDILTFIKEIPIIGPIFEDAFRTVWEIVKFYFGAVLIEVQFILDSIQNIFKFFVGVFTGDWGMAWRALKDEAATIWNALAGIFGLALDAIKAIANSKLAMLKGIGSDIGNAIADGFNAGISWLSGAARTVFNEVIDQINALIRAYNSVPLLPNVGEVPRIGPAPGSLSEGTNPGGGKIPGMAMGTSFVPRDMLAFLHRGEAVIPASENNLGGGVTINFTYAPMLSTASPAEAQRLAIELKSLLRGSL